MTTSLLVAAPCGTEAVFSCCECGRRLSLDEQNALVGNDGVFCPCGLAISDPWSVLVEPLSTDAHLMGDAANEASWFHWTERENWTDAWSFLTSIHVGSREAALTRREHLSRPGSRWDGSGWLYEVRLTEPVGDDKDDYETEEIEPEVPTRYVNVYEYPGSVSLVCAPRHLTVVNVTRTGPL